MRNPFDLWRKFFRNKKWCRSGYCLFYSAKMTVLSDEEWLKTRGEQNGNRKDQSNERALWILFDLIDRKQMNYMELYYADDFSLGEIAEEYEVSRQAVYDNIKRTSKILEDYEKKLHLFLIILFENRYWKIWLHILQISTRKIKTTWICTANSSNRRINKRNEENMAFESLTERLQQAMGKIRKKEKYQKLT